MRWIRIEIAGPNFPLADRKWHAGDRNDLATEGPMAHLTRHYGRGHESALQFGAYIGETTVNTPMSDIRSGTFAIDVAPSPRRHHGGYCGGEPI